MRHKVAHDSLHEACFRQSPNHELGFDFTEGKSKVLPSVNRSLAHVLQSGT
jgi:hypothetical protein